MDFGFQWKQALHGLEVDNEQLWFMEIIIN